MRLFRYLLILVLLPFAAQSAVHSVVDKHMQNPQPVGQAMLTYFFWDVYQATLYAPQGQWSDAPPFALALTYQRDFSGKEIADKTVEEMRKQGGADKQQLARWKNTMRTLFPDVTEGTTLIGVATDSRHTHFYHGDKLLGKVTDAEFTRRFFDIWLSEKTSEPGLRKKLLNLANSTSTGE